jgi:hypothetical protein
VCCQGWDLGLGLPTPNEQSSGRERCAHVPQSPGRTLIVFALRPTRRSDTLTRHNHQLQLQLIEMALYVSDISNPCRPQELAVKWAAPAPRIPIQPLSTTRNVSWNVLFELLNRRSGEDVDLFRTITAQRKWCFPYRYRCQP